MTIKYLTLKLTNRCNLKCVMCGQVDAPERISGDEIDLSNVKKILDDFPEIQHVYLFGGEPLLYSRFSELLEILRFYKKEVRITTNGTLLSEHAEAIVKSGIRNVEISMDSYKRDVLATIRGYDVLDDILNGIELLTEIKKEHDTIYPIINLNCVVLPHNYIDLLSFCDIVEEKMQGIEKINFELPIVITREQGRNQNQILKKMFNVECKSWKRFWSRTQLFTEKQLQELYEVLLKVQNRSISAINRIGTYNEFKEQFVHRECMTEKSCECPYAAVTILPNGDVTFCTDFPDVILGNVTDTNLSDIWRGEKARLFRKYLESNKNFPVCPSCVHKNEKLIESTYMYDM